MDIRAIEADIDALIQESLPMQVPALPKREIQCVKSYNRRLTTSHTYLQFSYIQVKVYFSDEYGVPLSNSRGEGPVLSEA